MPPTRKLDIPAKKWENNFIMSAATFRFFKGEADNPFDSRTDFSRHVFWEMESAAAAQGGSFKKLAEGPVPEIVRNWKADPEARGLLVFIMLMCGKWRPEDYGDVDWELYISPAA
jgi:hypothetical protein